MSTGQPPPPPAEVAGPPKPNRYHRHHKILVPTVASAAAAAAITLIVALIAAVILYRRFRCNRTAPTSPSDLKPDTSNREPLRRFTYSQLRRATSSFSPALKLGQGGFGPVYRGSLPSGQEIAVKLMDSGSLQGEREFQNELALAGKMIAAGTPADRARVVVPIGFCVDERKPKWWRCWQTNPEEDEDEELSMGPVGLGKRVLLVYELMHNGSLQDALLCRKCPELLYWGRRLSIAVDIARGMQFLHDVCDPPVIHGDIKPSNILLDSQFAARIADFGLARFKTAGGGADDDDAVIVEIDPKSPKDGKEEQVEYDAASVMGETVAESTTTAGLEDASGCLQIVVADKSPDEFDGGFARTLEGDELASPPVVALEMASTSEAGGFDRMSVESGKEIVASSSRKGFLKKGSDWWWRQDINGGGSSDSRGGVKDYVMEWIRSEIKKERPKSDWITAPAVSSEDCLPKSVGRPERGKYRKRLEWWASLDEERLKKEKKSRPAREWWREEFCEELTRKQKMKRMISKSKSNVEGENRQWWQEEEGKSPSERNKKRMKKSRSRSSQASGDLCLDGLSGEMKRTMTGRRRGQDWASGAEIPKSGGTISSTPSMRGTVCYVAPEYGGGGHLSEKCDIYSFGVLLLVLISGRRPLQVTASPMSEFERANLISWARHLAHLGRLLELVDPALKAVDKERALLCITVALLCIQRSPARRPSIEDIVGMLTGQSEPPHLPFEFSPSPPGGYSFKSRKKAR